MEVLEYQEVEEWHLIDKIKVHKWLGKMLKEPGDGEMKKISKLKHKTKEGLIKRNSGAGRHHVVMMALINAENTMKDINDFFKEKGWGKLTYVTEFKTLADQSGQGGRNDTVFFWTGTPKQLGTFSVQRFSMGADAPRWLDDYIENNREIIPSSVFEILKKIRYGKMIKKEND